MIFQQSVICICLCSIEPLVEARGKFSKEQVEDGEVRIDLDGLDSDRMCANARWEIKV